ncbi:MAG: hypothetical protein ABFD79_16610, partial [Phycisphaerales bacterium]
ETQESTNHGKFPGLAEIPVVGGLFKSKADTTTKKEVMIFITPQLIRDNEVAFSDRNTMINGAQEIEKLRSPEFYAMEKNSNKKLKEDEIQSLNEAINVLGENDEIQKTSTHNNTMKTSNEMSTEQEKQMIQQALSLLAVDSDAGKENKDK